MVETFNKKIDKSVIIASPKDETIKDCVIIDIQKGLLKEFLSPEVHSKFDNLDQDTLSFTIECNYNGKTFKVSDRIAYYDEPLSNSKLAKFLEKYETLEVGKKVTISFNKDGFGSIKLD